MIYCGGLNHNYDVEEFDRKDTFQRHALVAAEAPELFITELSAYISELEEKKNALEERLLEIYEEI